MSMKAFPLILLLAGMVHAGTPAAARASKAPPAPQAAGGRALTEEDLYRFKTYVEGRKAMA